MAKGALELDSVINAWESILLQHRFLMELSMVVIVESTITHLKKLKEREEVKKWEYMTSGAWNNWNDLGSDGWELVNVVTTKEGHVTGYFKRPLKEAQNDRTN